MELTVNLILMTEENKRINLEQMFNFDTDYNGENETMSDEAEKLGFNSDSEYFTDLVLKEFENDFQPKKMVDALYKLFNNNYGSCWDVAYGNIDTLSGVVFGITYNYNEE